MKKSGLGSKSKILTFPGASPNPQPLEDQSAIDALERELAARTWAKEVYLKLRETRDASESLDFLVQIIQTRQAELPAHAPLPEQIKLLPLWGREDHWDDEHEARKAAKNLQDEALRLDKRLRDLLAVQAQARDILDLSYQAAESPDSNASEVARYKKALEAWTEVSAQVEVTEGKYRKAALETQNIQKWQTRFQEVSHSLLKEYGNLGPQYEILVAELARTVIKREQLDNSGREVSHEEWTKISSQIKDLTNQLQRYTEAVKTEVIKTATQDAILKTLEVVERALSDHPHLWASVVSEVRTAVINPLREREASGVA